MTQSEPYIRRDICQYCLTEEGMADVDIQVNGETITITQCMKCKMIQQEED